MMGETAKLSAKYFFTCASGTRHQQILLIIIIIYYRHHRHGPYPRGITTTITIIIAIMTARSNFPFDLKVAYTALAPLLAQRIARSLRILLSEQRKELLSKMHNLITAISSLAQAILANPDNDSSSPSSSSALCSTVCYA